MNTNLNKLWTIKKALENENVTSVKEVNETSGGKAQLMLLDDKEKLIGFTKFYDIKKLREKVSRWLFKDYPIGA